MTIQVNNGEGFDARSWLFAPGDSERKMEKAAASAADVAIFDLEDAVAEEAKGKARSLVSAFLKAQPDRSRLWVRINPLQGPSALDDLAAIIPARPGGIMLPKARGRRDVDVLDNYLSALEVAAGCTRGSTKVIVLVTETAEGMFTTGTYSGAPRMVAMTWGAEDLADAVGASGNRNADGSYEFTYELARSLCLLGAAAAGVNAVETIHGDYRDEDGLRKRAERVRRAGYRGMLAIHPAQVGIINEAFTPRADELAAAREIVDLFAANPGAGTIGFKGSMLDRPHLARARALLRLGGTPMTLTVEPSALDLRQFLRPGDRIVWGQACGEPTTLIEALLAQAGSIGDLSAFAATSFSGQLDVAAGEKIAISSLGAIGELRTLTAAHRLRVVPCHVSQVGPMISQGLIGCDAAFVQVSPADANGQHSYGLIADFTQEAVMNARVVIAEVNECVPFTHGDVVLPASRIDCAVRVARPPVELAPARIGDVDHAIARIVAGYIEDGAVLQVGIGAVPDAILRLLRDRRDLGIHSGMIGDATADLIDAGVVTNALKPIDAGVSVTTALIGTRRLYEFAHRNSSIAVRSSAYTHDSSVLSRLRKFVTINSAVEVDLTGQVNAEQSGAHYVGGTGGQVEFVRAGSRSIGGHSIIALPATAKGGKVSRITVDLSGPVTTARSDVDIVVTEFGAAELKGRTLAERTRRLIAIAHPAFREELDRAARTIQTRGF